jgi:hypothetical protein
MSSYYAKVTSAMGGSERLVAVTGQLQGGLLRVVDVDIQGNPIGSATYLPANAVICEMFQASTGLLVDERDGPVDDEEIDWAAHEDKPRNAALDEAEGEDGAFVPDEDYLEGEGKPNPMLAAIIRKE